jgi:hypothetical protein
MAAPDDLINICQQLIPSDLQFIGASAGLAAGVYSTFSDGKALLMALKDHLQTWEQVRRFINKALRSSVLNKDGVADQYFPELNPSIQAVHPLISNHSLQYKHAAQSFPTYSTIGLSRP